MPIYVCGDITIDNYEFYGEFAKINEERLGLKIDPNDGLSSRSDQNKIVARELGGAYLLARFIAAALSLWRTNAAPGPIRLPDMAPWQSYLRITEREYTDLLSKPRIFDDILQLSYRVRKYPDKKYRVEQGGHEGFTLPTVADVSRKGYTRVLDPTADGQFEELDENVPNTSIRMLVVNDAGHGSRWLGSNNLASSIAELFESEGSIEPWAVVRFLPPLNGGYSEPNRGPFPAENRRNELLDILNAKFGENVVGIVTANDLRESGLLVSRSLSWDQTLQELVCQVLEGKVLPHQTPGHLVVTFDYDAALYLRIRRVRRDRRLEVSDANGVFVYSARASEGDYASKHKGEMPGARTAFVSVFATLLYRYLRRNQKSREIGAANVLIAHALMVMRRLQRAGFCEVEKHLFNKHSRKTFRQIRRRSSANPCLIARVRYQEGIFSLATGGGSDAPGNDGESLLDPHLEGEDTPRRAFIDPLSRTAGEFRRDLRGDDLAEYIIKPGKSDLKSDDLSSSWSIFGETFKERGKDIDWEVFLNYVLCKNMPRNIPIGEFGEIVTVDRKEIEDFRTIRNLLLSFLSNRMGTDKPLGIAVFGRPGAGKSFAVRSIIRSLPDTVKAVVQLNGLECNLSGLSEPEDLANYFHLARDSALRGRVPVLFFDEFDCAVDREEFFWLKHFLAPLQDGEFRTAHVVHPIGKAIFVFAGSVFSSFEEFRDRMERNRRACLKQRSARDSEPNFKGVDFLSRLHGHMDVKGLSPESRAHRKAANGTAEGQGVFDDQSYLMRRALAFRALLERNAPNIFVEGPEETKGVANIDQNVVKAILATDVYRHGTRSMEAIIRMSSLAERDRFDVADLPPDSQLSMHVDKASFKRSLELPFKALSVRRPTPQQAPGREGSVRFARGGERRRQFREAAVEKFKNAKAGGKRSAQPDAFRSEHRDHQ